MERPLSKEHTYWVSHDVYSINELLAYSDKCGLIDDDEDVIVRVSVEPILPCWYSSAILKTLDPPVWPAVSHMVPIGN